MPISLNAEKQGMKLAFSTILNKESAKDISNYKVKTWDIKRSSSYGSDRYNVKTLEISRVKLGSDGKEVKLVIDEIAPVDIMTIEYDILDEEGVSLKGTVQNTIHALGKDSL
jgi:hypothetical protein